MVDINSALVSVSFIFCRSRSIVSLIPIGSKTFLRSHIFCKSSSGRRSSSFRVPERFISIEGKVLLSASFLSRTISRLPVPLNSSKITSSILLPVSTRAVAIIVKLPPSSRFRAAPKKTLWTL